MQRAVSSGDVEALRDLALDIQELSELVDENVPADRALSALETLFLAARNLAKQAGTELELDERLELARAAKRACVLGDQVASRVAERIRESASEDETAAAELNGRRFRERRLNAAILEADLQRLAGKPDAARAALDDVMGVDAAFTLPFARNKLAEVLLEAGDLSAAGQLFHGAEPLDTEHRRYEQLHLRQLTLRARYYASLGLALEAQRLVDEAQRLEREVRKDAGSSSLHPEFWRIDLVAVECALEVGAWARARERVADALLDTQLYERRPTWRGQLSILDGVALEHLERTSPEVDGLAEAAFERALEAIDVSATRATAELRLAGLAVTDGRIEEAARRLDGVEQRIEQFDELTPADRYLFYTQRARLLRDDAAPAELAACLERLTDESTRMRERWLEMPLLPGGIGLLRDTRLRGFFSEFLRLAVLVHGRERGAVIGVEELIRVQALGSIGRRLGLDAPSLVEVRDELLAPGRGILFFLPGPYRSHVFAIDAEQCLLAEGDPEDLTLELLYRWKPLLFAPLQGAVDAELRQSERKLAAEVMASIVPSEIRTRLASWREVFFVGADLCTTALPVGPLPLVDARPAASSLELAHLPSLPFGVHLARQRSRRTDSARATEFKLVGGVDLADAWTAEGGGGELVPLTLDVDDITRLTGPFDASHVRVHTGREATREVFEGQDLSDVALLEIYTHGLLRYEDPRPFRLVLTPTGPDDDGLLASEGLGQTRGPRAVVLAACKSGRAPSRLGDEDAASMASAWLVSGSDVVLHSPEDMLYGPALQLGAFFNAALAKGLSPARALRQASQRMASEPQTQDPCFYALVQLVGLGHEPVFPKQRGRRALAFVVLGLVAVAALALALRRRA